MRCPQPFDYIYYMYCHMTVKNMCDIVGKPGLSRNNFP